MNNEMTYADYRELMDTLVAEEKSTGTNPTEALVMYTALNHKRMKRLDKKGTLTEEQLQAIKELKQPIKWVVLTESWCGDAAQILPYINKIANSSELIDLKIVLRDEHLDLMDQHLTNGGRAIPKLIMYNADTNETIGSFGPRPQKATDMVQAFKAAHGSLSDEFKKDLQLWYTKDKGQEIINDILQLID